VTTRIAIEPTSVRGERGLHYRVLYAGAVLIEDTWNAEYDAARALVAKGIAGKVEVWQDGKAVSAMDAERADELTIVENANVGPRVGPWAPFSPYGHQTAVSSYSVPPPAAVSGCPGVLEPADENGRW
jgi:hypothetical protein